MAAGDFVINVCSERFGPFLEGLAKEYPADVDEAELHGLTLEPSVRVASPGVAEALARLECVVHRTVELGTERAPVVLVVAEMVAAVLDDAVLADTDLDHPRIDLIALAPVGRSGARTFLRTAPETVFHQERVTYEPPG